MERNPIPTASELSQSNDPDLISKAVIGAAFSVHSALGPGMLESAYQVCLAHELELRGFSVRREVAVPVRYKRVRLDYGYRLDLLVNDCLVIELKAKESLTDVDLAQMITYLKFGDYRLGLLLNFHEKELRKGIRRVINSR